MNGLFCFKLFFKSRTILYLLLILIPKYSFAALGDAPLIVENDVKNFASEPATETLNDNYKVYEFKTTQYILKQYTTTDGTVFAVSWRGDKIPNLKNVLGKYYDEFKNAELNGQINREPRRSLNIKTEKLIFNMSGHIHNKKGSAYDPKLVPSTFKMENI